MTMVINYGHIFGIFMIKLLGLIAHKKEIIAYKTHLTPSFFALLRVIFSFSI